MFIGEWYAGTVRDFRQAPQHELAILPRNARDQRAYGRGFPARESFTAVLRSCDLVDEPGDPFLQFDAVRRDFDFLQRFGDDPLQRARKHRKRNGNGSYRNCRLA